MRFDKPTHTLPIKADILVIGGGVIGINIARYAKIRWPAAQVALIEKEAQLGSHASGRNSGVLHAGFYYTADSLKARFTREGNQALTEYCSRKNLRLHRCGKLVVAQGAEDLAGLDILLDRAHKNGVELHDINKQQAQAIEPRVKTYRRALFSPTTASVDPQEVVAAMVQDARQQGIILLTGTAYQKRHEKGIVTTQGLLPADYVINAAGLYADHIARDFGFSKNYCLLPFKGLYLYGAASEKLNTNIYPVPNLQNPFLGVHFTVTADGKTKIGPTAIPAFWREQYSLCENFDFQEFLETFSQQLKLLIKSKFAFRQLALKEIKKYYRPYLLSQAAMLLHGVNTAQYKTWGKPGIRAQLFNQKTGLLEMDFVIEGDQNSLHVLNAVSPAFTCSIPFAKFVVDKIAGLRKFA